MVSDFLFQKYRNYLFDFDGTLCDTELDIKETWQKVFAQRNIVCPNFEKIFRVGPSLAEITAEFFPERSMEFRTELIQHFGQEYDKSTFSHSKPYPGMEKFLLSLQETGKKLFIVTNKRYISLKHLLKKLQWESRFSGVYSPTQTDPPLRKTELVALLLKEHHIAKNETVIIGDSPGDITAGKQNGIHALGVQWGYGSPEELTQAGADDIISAADL